MYSIFEKLMSEAGETHYQVAKATGVSQSTLSDWKLGKTTPRNPTMKKIADHYGVSVSYLKGETTERTAKQKPASQETGGLTKEDIDLLIKIKTAPEAKKKAILELLKGWEDG